MAGPPARRTRVAWTPLVAASAAALALALVAVAISWAVSQETRIASYAVRGELARVELDVRSGRVEIADAGGGAVQVRRTDRFAYGRSSEEHRSIGGGVLRIHSRCPSVVVGSCSADYRVAVPENVPVSVRTGDGDVHVAAFRGSVQIQTGAGDVGVDAFCVVPFTADFSRLSPEAFVHDVLVEHLHAALVVEGENFRFGHRAAGDVAEGPPRTGLCPTANTRTSLATSGWRCR